jgi:hypothetical protein
MNMNLSQQQRLTVSDSATPFGCCNFFSQCSDELMSLHYGGRLTLLDWMNFSPSDICLKEMEYISYVRPAQYNRAPTAGHLADPCADPNGIEIGSCKVTLRDFGRYGRKGPTRRIMQPDRYCITSPRRRLDGTVVADEREWDMRFAMDVLLGDIRTDVITGSTTNAGQFDGLERLVKTGYDCSILDSIVVDWNGNPMTGGSGITWNGNPIAATYNFVDVLLSAIRRIKQRIMWSPLLGNQQMDIGNMILVLPSFMANCLLDHYTCWSVCDGSQYNEVALQAYESRVFRNNLLGGMFGAGRIFVDGFEIPLLTYDWGTIKGPTTGDVYLLTGAVGSVRLFDGEHLSAATAASNFGNQGYFSVDGGRVLGLYETDNECYELKVWMHPRLWCAAPWAQIRFQDVVCRDPMGPLSGDPDDTSFYPLTSFNPATCP